ncbi:TonB-dependent receptor [Algoriphagus sp.]|jgi:Fe(3+) dicitrate transport protein|uniref:TonB-dependent receptor n=1 Tax=Algoriphagus sp. TaxID=1872435 RepID=UPI0027198BD3|nr:TonB-dependent receptor [Algoriphagus sp.]MDO8965889.1 TonB-dependent receptor [Algoriphagus sp.]MDP3201059.1 TonB-dependent receptor [Algoriphagus sp.]
MLVNALMLLFVAFSHPSPRPTNDSYKIDIADAVVSVSGKVKTPSGQPVSYANVAVKGSVKGAFTDLDGNFQLFDLSDGSYEIEISAVGYKTMNQLITVVAGKLVNLEVVFEEEDVQMPQFAVIANRDRIFSKVPGSVDFLDKAEIKNLHPISGNEVLRRVAGVHVVDEEGAGMRVNIGIRGLDPDRSRSVLVLEDGVPVALAPYGEPEMYYSPAIDRMAGVEILKGSGQILYGPQTIGGVVNYITPNPPSEQEGAVRIQGGQGGFYSNLINYGNTFGNTGFQVNLLNKGAKNIGPTEFKITDFNTKFLFNFNEKSELGLKLGLYNESSNSTYIGINQVMYDQGGNDFARLAPDDQLDVQRYSVSFNHVYRFNPNVKLRTLAYGYTTTRNWNRQDFSINANNTPPANWTGVVWGDRSIPGGAIFMRNSTGNRNRQFAVGGIEPRLEVNHSLFSFKNELIVGARYLEEKALEQRINGTKAGVQSGNLVEDEQRDGKALSAYFQNSTDVSEKLSFNVGMRVENFNYDRNIFRRNFSGRGIRDTVLVAGSNITEVIPGAGFNFKPVKMVTIFGGVHKGFAPPRTKDAITSTGDALDLEAEKSWNYELGLRSVPTPWLFLEATAFLMDFSNQIIPVSESSGGLGFGVVNAGATRHQGLEGSVNIDISQLLNSKKWNVLYDVNVTYVNAFYNADRFISDININGNRTPYAPEWLVNSSLAVESNSGFGARLTANYVGAQFGDELNTIVPSVDGLIGEIPSYFLLDAVLSYKIAPWNSAFNLSIKNLTDERYISTRRPQGIRVGLPRFITAGFEINF